MPSRRPAQAQLDGKGHLLRHIRAAVQVLDQELRGGAPDWIGVSIVAGTYNAIGARRGDGRVFHLGFWPDGAGGRDISNEGLRAVYHAALGMGPATTLTESALALYEAYGDGAYLDDARLEASFEISWRGIAA